MRVFLDANIHFSSAYTDGAIRKLVLLLLENGHVCCVDLIAVEEARRNIAVHRAEALPALELMLTACDVALELTFSNSASLNIDLPDGDLHILRASIALRCDYLVTGDKRHFGPYFETIVQGTTIVSPLQLFRRLK